MKTRILYALLVIFFILNGVHAQENLSLSEAIQIALKKNYDILIETKNIAIAKNNNSWGRAGKYPNISLRLRQNNTLQHTTNPTSFIQGNVIRSDFQPSINLNWVLFNGMKAMITKRRLDILHQQAQGNAEIVVQNTIQAVIQAYYAATLEQKRLEIIRNTLNLSRDKYDYLMIKKNIGSAVTSDVLLEKSNYLTDSSRYINQKVVYQNAIRRLNVLLAEENSNTSRNLTDTLYAVRETYEYEDLENKMFAQNINLKLLQIQQNNLRQNAKLQQAKKYPTISMNATGNYSAARQDLTNARFINGKSGEVSIATNNNSTVGFSVSMPVFNNGNIRRNIQNANIREEIGRLRITRQRQQLAQQLTSTLDLYNTRRELWKIAMQNKKTAETNLEIAQERFKTGLINSFNYRTLQNNLLNASFAELEAVFNLNDSKINILRLTGDIMKIK